MVVLLLQFGKVPVVFQCDLVLSRLCFLVVSRWYPVVLLVVLLVVLWWCPGGVPVVLVVVFQRCPACVFGGFPVVSRLCCWWCCGCVLVVSRLCFGGVLVVSQWFSGRVALLFRKVSW